MMGSIQRIIVQLDCDYIYFRIRINTFLPQQQYNLQRVQGSDLGLQAAAARLSYSLESSVSSRSAAAVMSFDDSSEPTLPGRTTVTSASFDSSSSSDGSGAAPAESPLCVCELTAAGTFEDLRLEARKESSCLPPFPSPASFFP